MLRSDYCNLAGLGDRALTDLGECPYDQGGYFVINGSEKVLIAQVRRLVGGSWCGCMLCLWCSAGREGRAGAAAGCTVHLTNRGGWGLREGSGLAVAWSLPWPGRQVFGGAATGSRSRHAGGCAAEANVQWQQALGRQPHPRACPAAFAPNLSCPAAPRCRSAWPTTTSTCSRRASPPSTPLRRSAGEWRFERHIFLPSARRPRRRLSFAASRPAVTGSGRGPLPTAWGHAHCQSRRASAPLPSLCSAPHPTRPAHPPCTAPPHPLRWPRCAAPWWRAARAP